MNTLRLRSIGGFFLGAGCSGMGLIIGKAFGWLFGLFIALGLITFFYQISFLLELG